MIFNFGISHSKLQPTRSLPPKTMSIKPPPLLWRAASTATMATTGILSRLFLYGTQRVKIDGMEAFLALLRSRQKERNLGLLTGLFDLITGFSPG